MRRTMAICAAVALGASAWAALDPARGGFAVLLAAFACLAGVAAWLEGSPGSAKDLTLVATHDRELPAHRRFGLCVSETQAALRGARVGA